MKMETEKRKVWVISVLLKDIDPDDGEEIHWNGEMPEYYADTYNEAEVIAKKLLNGDMNIMGIWLKAAKSVLNLLKWNFLNEGYI